ncbi:uncharacterized protein LOC132562485 [Ylistrum balloti]|uniref:uncharacterized protein LOC132562485 n=1 Tax=Ylistrum balloti TaxID=509963 RepID=UPI002905B5C3|nr:uncharacterized protein LOC132562485 [Ylistrum balloti]
MVQDTITWNQAATACRARNGSLAVIRNSETNSRLLQRAQNLDSNDRAEVSFYWIGGRIQARGDAITWELDVNGAAVGNPFTAYAEDQPSGFGERGCVLMDPSVMGWATEYCELDFELVGYVCEYEPNGSMSNMRTRMSKVLLTFLLTVVLGHAV